MEGEYQDIFYKELSKKIRVIRIGMNLTQDDFAVKLNISRSSIVNIEKNRQRPSIHLLYEIALLAGINMDIFFDSLPKKEPEQTISEQFVRKMDGLLDEKSKQKVQDFISRIPSKE